MKIAQQLLENEELDEGQRKAIFRSILMAQSDAGETPGFNIERAPELKKKIKSKRNKSIIVVESIDGATRNPMHSLDDREVFIEEPEGPFSAAAARILDGQASEGSRAEQADLLEQQCLTILQEIQQFKERAPDSQPHLLNLTASRP